MGEGDLFRIFPSTLPVSFLPILQFSMNTSPKQVSYTQLAPSWVQAISPYIPGKPIAELSREMGMKEESIIKLASNENPLGCSPKVLMAIGRAMSEVHRYPDGSCFLLRHALSSRLQIPSEQIVIGNGSNELLDCLALAYLVPGTSAVYSQYCFAVYPITTLARGATSIQVPAREWGADLSAMRSAIRPDTRLIFIANPNNPTGTFIPWKQLRDFIDSVPRTSIVVLDEAYNDFLPDDKQENTEKWLAEFPHLVITRTFCKIYGLASLRVGYMLGHPEVCDMLNRVRAPFNVNMLAQVAAEAALSDTDFVQRVKQNNQEGLAYLCESLKKMGLSFIPPHGNFITVDVKNGPQVASSLLKKGIIVRPLGNYAMPAHIRVTVGLPEENQRFIRELPSSL